MLEETVKRARQLLFFLLALGLAGCASSSLRRNLVDDGFCALPSKDLVGTWRSERLSQLGPSWMRFTFHCDCTYESRVQLLWMRYTEKGQYRVGPERITFIRPGGKSAWPYDLAEGSLTLAESERERHSYKRVATEACPGPR
jgi:hypothetical protein